MSERSLLFKGEMVRAILAGSKTQTRRIIAGVPVGAKLIGQAMDPHEVIWRTGRFAGKSVPVRFHAGDRLWVKEAFAVECEEDGPTPFSDGRPSRQVEGFGWEQCHYRASDPDPELACEHKTCDGDDSCSRPWRSPMFMPRWASRINLEIVNVRVQRLQDITEEDAKAEGVERTTSIGPCRAMGWRGHDKDHMRAVSAFASLWDSINAARGFGWTANPWIWALTFRRTKP